MDVDLPSAGRLPKFLKDYGSTSARAGRTKRITVALGSRSHEVHAIRSGTTHHRRKPSIRGRKVRGHKVVVIQVPAIVIAHRPLSGNVIERRLNVARIMSGCENETIKSSRA